MNVIVIGTRGIPDYLGGVETHCQELYPRIQKLDCNVEVIRRSAYKKDNNDSYKGVLLKDVFSPKKKSFEAIVHTFISILYARYKSPDLVHIHAIGPSLLVPFARLLGLKVITTNHGPDYDRQKWGRLAKLMLQVGERLGAKYSNEIIAISPVIQDILLSNYGRKSSLVFNGIAIKKEVGPGAMLSQFGLEGKKYIVAVGRFVEEKGFHDLIDAFNQSKFCDYKLVILGDAEYSDKYSNNLKKIAIDSGVILPGFLKGDALIEVFSNARLFVMPSYHEGLPIALLEAMSYSLPVVVSDIKANLAVELDESDYFPVGDVSALSNKICEKIENGSLSVNYSKYLAKYNWDGIAEQTYNIYREVTQA